MDATREPGREVGDVGALVARIIGSADEPGVHQPAAGPRARGRELGSLTRALAGSARTAGRASVLGGRWLADLLVDIAPRIPLRDGETLRRHHPGLTDDELAEALVAGAARATAAVGAAGGALAAVEFAAPPTLLTAPAQIAAETLVVAAIEIKLLAELHEVYGVVLPGNRQARAMAYVFGWTNRRGIDPREAKTLRLSLGKAARVALRRRLVLRAGRNLTTMGPLLSGAVAGSLANHRETRRFGAMVRADLARTGQRRPA